MNKEEKQRTLLQNKCLHAFFTGVSDAARENNLTMQQILAQSVELEPTPMLIKELWRSIQVAMFQKMSTTELSTKEVQEVYEVFNRFLGEKFHIHVPWPSVEEQTMKSLTEEPYENA